MPQMNPIWWVPLFIMFILILLLVNPLNYFNKNNSLQSTSSAVPHSYSKNWKW